MYPLSFQEIQELSQNYNPLINERALLDLLFRINSEAYSELNQKTAREYITSLLYSVYPNEATIKSAFINSILSKDKTSVSTFEFPVGNCRADLCKINNNSYAYEIKTDFDNLKRIEKQISNYRKVFEYTYVICSPRKVSDVEKTIDSDVGVIVYKMGSKKNYTFRIHRKSLKSDFIDPVEQLKALSTTELDTLSSAYGLKVNAPLVMLINHLGKECINKEFKKAIQHRYHDQWSFLIAHMHEICNIDYQYFYRTGVDPCCVYK